MVIPAIHADSVVSSSLEGMRGVPIMPFLPMLLLKLQGWADHAISHRIDMRMKQYVDVSDIKELLDIAAKEMGLREQKHGPLSESFIQAGRSRVLRFIAQFPESRAKWELL